MRYLLRLIMLLKPFSWQVLLSILLGCATVFAGIGLLGTSAYLITSAALKPSIADLQVAIVGVRFFGLSRGVFRYLERLISHSVNLKILTRLRTSFYERIEPGAPANLYPYRSGDLLNRVMGDLETIENFYVRFFAPVVISMVVITGVSLFAGGYRLELGIILASGLVLNAFVLPLFIFLKTRSTGKELVEAKSALSAGIVEVLQGLTDLQAYNVQDQWYQKIRLAVNKAGKLQERNLIWNSIGNSFSLLVMNLTIIGLLLAAIPAVRAGGLNGVSLAVITLVALASFEASASLPNAAVVLANSLESIRNLSAVGNEGTSIIQPVDQRFVSCPQAIEFEHVSFSYEDGRKGILKDVSFQLKPGKSLGLTGISGVGKTTLLNLLVGFLEPQSGRILIDGVDRRDLELDQLRRSLGIVSQQPYLFNEDIRTNLLLARTDATDDQMITALASAGLEEWLHSLPQGLSTWIGEHGVKLSAGERQRLAITRLILQDPAFILLDEPTANLDPVLEEKLIRELFLRFSGRGILLVTHRLDLLRYTDNVLILQDSRITEQGRFDVLANRKGIFNSLLELSRNNIE